MILIAPKREKKLQIKTASKPLLFLFHHYVYLNYGLEVIP